jgi:dipeptidyl aminopeptidase/acylaminoacyl peptidase
MRCLALVLLLTPALNAAPERTHDITLDDYFSLDIIAQFQVAPRGTHVAYAVSRWDKPSDGRKVDLWVVDTQTAKSRRLTFDHAGVAAPRWGRDGKSVYFLARQKREAEKQPPLDGSAQVWRVAIDGGVPQAVTRIAGGVETFDLAPDGEALYYQVGADKPEGEWAKLKQQFKVEYSYGAQKVSQIWKLNLLTWKSEKVYDEGRNVREFALSPDGKSIALITTPDGTVVTFEGRSRVDVFDITKGKSVTVPDECFRAKAASPYGWLQHLAWNESGTAVAFNVVFDAYPAEIVIASKGEGGWASRLMKRPEHLHVRGYGSPLAWLKDHTVEYLGEEKGRVRRYLVDLPKDDRHRNIDEKTNVVIESFSSVSPASGSVVTLQNDTTHTPDLFHHEKRLTNLNPQVDTWKLPKISVVRWKSKDGTEVEGILELPPDHKEGQKLPLVVCIHGGPTTADRYHLQYWIYGRTLLPAKGYAVLCPNYRGSTGYGDRFLTDLVGHENERDVEDILGGVDSLVEKGIADPNRLGVSGWSNGGYLTNCLITKTTRFKAASSGAGIVDTVTEWGTNDEPAYAMVFKKGFPWNQSELYKKTSPTYALDRIRTPTLIHVGANDERCPPGHSRMLYRALKEYVKVPTELLVYPGEAHGLTKYSHRKAKMEWDLAWFDRYILGKK